MAPVYDCLSCRTAPPPWAALGFYGSYSGLLRDLVHRHKFGRDHGLGVILRFMVLQAWRLHALERPDIIVPVPMRPMPVLRRGFNQSAELGRLLAGALGVAFAGQGLLKIRETRAQSSLGRAARMRNVAGAFRAARDVAGRRVLLVDDVMTTGATMRACSRACREAGAARIEVLVLARAS
ncbi:MAG: ComF family protein [Desulfovibrionales bacterium]|nr:ComF family protein [Desulfovibrionales bacterium]